MTILLTKAVDVSKHIKQSKDIFNVKTTGKKHYDRIMSDKGKDKKVKGKVIYMKPDDYIDCCVEGFKLNGERGVSRETVMESRKYHGSRHLMNAVSQGNKIDIPVLDYKVNGKGKHHFAQDGLHRSMFAQQQGLNKIPVLVVRHRDHVHMPDNLESHFVSEKYINRKKDRHIQEQGNSADIERVK